MSVIKKTVWLLCLVLTITMLASCSSNGTTSAVSSEISKIESEVSSEIVNNDSLIFSLPYFSDDSFNPYSAKQSANFYLGTLIYDSLVTVDPSFKTENLLADSIVLEEDVLKVTLKKGLKFSDGSDITEEDVKDSFQTAKGSSFYSERLSNISSCTVKGQEILFKLSKPHKGVIKNLTFPIIKNGAKTNMAIGSGRYKFASENVSDGLVLNEYQTQRKSSIESIDLVEIHKYSVLPHMIKIGSVNFIYATFSDSDLKTAAAKTSDVVMNNLVYLGVNSNNPHLANADFRKAVSLSINRDNIASDAYANSGYATAGPFHPSAKDLASKDYKFDLSNTSAAQELFGVCALTQKNDDGIFVVEEDKPLVLKLAVNKDNTARLRAAKSIKLSLEAAGISVELIEEDTAKYKERIADGDYDLFIGEVKLTADNDISKLLTMGSLNLCDDGGETLTAYNQYLNGEISLEDFLRAFDLKTPFIPLFYRNGTAVFSGTLDGNSDVTEYDVFAAMSNWEF